MSKKEELLTAYGYTHNASDDFKDGDISGKCYEKTIDNKRYKHNHY